MAEESREAALDDAPPRPGDTVRLRFELRDAANTLLAGAPLDATPAAGDAADDVAGDTVEFVLGARELAPVLERLLLSARLGERHTHELPADAFGNHDPALIQEMPLTEFPPDSPPRRAQVLEFSLPSGERLAGEILDVGAASARVDFNPPLAGRRTRFSFEIVAVRRAALP